MSWRRAGISLAIALGLVGGLLVLVSCITADEQPTSSPDYQQMRLSMVHALQAAGILRSEPVIAAMQVTPRHLFVPEEVRPLAYTDIPLPIGEDQTISAPSIVAKMTELLQPDRGDVILEVGTGSGYQAAVLAKLVKHVYTIEILGPLANSARQRLAMLGYENITVKCGDGYRGWPQHAPFDGIIVTCAPEEIPQPLVQQLKEGGCMVIPVGPESGTQYLYLLKKKGEGLQQTSVWPVRFVPMTGQAQEQ